MTVLSVAAVLVVYAALLGTINSTGYVNVGGTGGTVYYSLTNTDQDSAWSNSLGSGTPLTISQAWYAKMNTTAGGYVGLASFSWQLRKSTDGGSTWNNVGTATTFDYSLDGSVQTIYATSNGAFAEPGNRDWHLTSGYGTGLWKVEVTISTST